LQIPAGFEGQVRPAVDLALRGVTCLNSPGTIDADYRGDVFVLLINLADAPITIQPGTEIGVLVISEVVRAEWQLVDELNPTDRGDGAFGSTGQ
jgi:dUTP pyrophosphatase